MITPTMLDHLRVVVYARPFTKPQFGVLSSHNDKFAFVLYGPLDGTAQATAFEDLQWIEDWRKDYINYNADHEPKGMNVPPPLMWVHKKCSGLEL